MANKNNTNEIRINGNCKAVRCTTDGAFYPGMKYAAEAAGVSSAYMSNAIKNKTACKGKHYRWESETKANVVEMGRNLEVFRAKADAYDRLMAKQEAERKAEEERQEKLRKAKEEHQKAIAKAQSKVDMYEAECERRKARLKLAEDKLMAAQIELEALLDTEV